ncbi:MAG TPA: DMT family transporter [Candidatus Peribacterales bacterium]|nr:DMT family transporter [Candidatus Peribacterales bacterium]
MWLIFAFSAAVAYSLQWILFRMSRGVPSTIVTATEYITGPLLFLIALRTVDYPWHEPWFWAYLTLPFLLIPFFVWSTMYAVHRVEVTYVKPLFGLSSMTTLLVASVFFGESISAYAVTGLVCITFGLLTLYHGRWAAWRNVGPWIILAAALFYGVNAAVVAKVLQKFPDVLGVIALVFLGSFLLNLPMAIRDLRTFRFSRNQLLILLSMVITTLLQDFLTLVGFTFGPSPYVIAIKRTSILLTAVIGYFFLNERDQSLNRLLLASGFVVIGVVFIVLS